jgi:CheY-like chemotaxis protein
MCTNLLLNAIDAMPNGGRLTVTTRTDKRGWVVLTVADTGIGMSETVRRRIFEPFFSTKGEAGSGLGLAMVYSIVKRHGGEIRVDSEPGKGATFTITLPAATEALSEQRAPDQEGPRRLARVLMVDDDPQVLSTLAELLSTLGHTITQAKSGPVALELYAPGGFDVVLSNVGMAGMNGWEFAGRLREVDVSVPILFITGWGLREEDHARLVAMKIHRCLFKPVRPAELDAAIQAALPA